MVSVNFQNNVKVYQMSGTKINQSTPFPATNSNQEKVTRPQFRAEGYSSAISVQTTLITSSDKKKYKELSEELDSKYRQKLEYALKTGILLKNNSDDKSTVLDNLHKILKEERDAGLDGKTLLKECLDIIHNPYVITQTCEDIPREYKTPIIGLISNLSEDEKTIREVNFNLDNMHTGTCPTASVEFDLATRQPAEFFRMVEGLTSPKNEIKKTINLDSLSEKTLDAIWLLNKFRTPYEIVENSTLTTPEVQPSIGIEYNPSVATSENVKVTFTNNSEDSILTFH